MSAVILGPQGPNFTTLRPATDPVASGALQTWFQPCSAPGTTDGTEITASWLNGITAQLRTVIIDAATDAEGEPDDMLKNAILAMVDAGGGSGFAAEQLTTI
ncbi:hypothetical protein [Labrys wisconsinensis]|uniref:Uncharacterized protein n=1 Tax=Labrys wisconsinensis TaxID=425677 RepID=A0ABU0JEW4_9HYPH|nr:hypothetical protein [Labrys wisconsinensis]MDQ0472826.1 hypothetical protein [Labrys wisconsinensis]